MHDFFVYLLASRHRTLYVGVTHDLQSRVAQHRLGLVDSFTRKYNIHRLVYFEKTSDVLAAITREKQIKSWRRDKKVALIEKSNPDWLDLGDEWPSEHGRASPGPRP